MPRWALFGAATLTALAVLTNSALYLVPVRSEQRVAPDVLYHEQWAENSEFLGAYIAAHTTPDDTIFNLGRESQIYFYADRRPAARYFYDYVYSYDPETVRLTIDALRAAKPAFIIDSIQPPLFQPSDRPPEFDRFLSEDYEYGGHLYFADLYRLKAH